MRLIMVEVMLHRRLEEVELPKLLIIGLKWLSITLVVVVLPVSGSLTLVVMICTPMLKLERRKI